MINDLVFGVDGRITSPRITQWIQYKLGKVKIPPHVRLLTILEWKQLGKVVRSEVNVQRPIVHQKSSQQLTQKLPLFDQAGAPEEFDALPLLAPPIFVPSLENTLGFSMLPSPLLSRPPLVFSFSPTFSLLPSRLPPPPPSPTPAFRLLPLPDFEDMAATWNKEMLTLNWFVCLANAPDGLRSPTYFLWRRFCL